MFHCSCNVSRQAAFSSIARLHWKEKYLSSTAYVHHIYTITNAHTQPTFLSKFEKTRVHLHLHKHIARLAQTRVKVYAHSLTCTQSLATAKSHKIFYEARRLEPRVRMSAESTRCVSAPDAHAAAMNGNAIRKIITSSSKCYGSSSSPGNPSAIDFPRSRRLIYAARCPCRDKFLVL
jgi:hypothetical protein